MRNTAGALVGTMAILMLACPAMAQERSPDRNPEGGFRNLSYVLPGPVSPSTATTTVSPSSVPQAMERMSDGGTRADLSLGMLYAEGKFGTDSRTTIWNTAIGGRLRAGDLTVSASLPYMRIRSRSTIFTGIDATPVLVEPNTSATRRTAEGFGDLTLGATYTFASSDSPVEIELSGRAKINTATQSSGLSSGENDYAVGVDWSMPLGRITPFVSYTYRFLGDTDSFTLRNGSAASGGASYALSDDTFVLASYHYSRSATTLVDDAHELFAGASTRLAGSQLRLTGFATAGLSRGAADLSAGLAVSMGFFNRDRR